MTSALMIDCETVDITPNAGILTIGVVVFNPLGNGIKDQLELRPTLEDQMTFGRTIDDGTLKWWAQQSKEAQDEAFGDHDRISFREAMEHMHKFCWNRDEVWAHGAAFDVVLMETGWANIGMKPAWPFNKVRDTRTLFAVTGVKLRDGGFKTSHRAVDDAERQALCVQESYRRLLAAGLPVK